MNTAKSTGETAGATIPGVVRANGGTEWYVMGWSRLLIDAKLHRISPRRELYPRTAQFYDQLPNDPRFEQVHREVAVPWQSSGPTITVHRVKHRCSASVALEDNA